MNQQSIYWQKCGFSREAAIYLLNQKNYKKYIVEENGVKKLRRTILECGNPIVEGDADRVQYNMPELFTE